MKVHILYLTTDCNLRCPYCYEGDRKNTHKRVSFAEIDEFIDTIVREEGHTGHISTLCLLGGEPFLEFDKIKYTYSKCKELKLRGKASIAINVITNGTLIERYFDDLVSMITSNVLSVSLDVSYDGINQHLRTGNSTVVEDNILRLKERGIPFGISYTVTSNNGVYNVLLTELVTMLEKFFKNTDSVQGSRIKLSFDLQSLTEKFGLQSKEDYISPIKTKLDYLYSLYKIPFCDISCSLCGRCNPQLFNNKEYCIPGRDNYLVEEMYTEKPFDHF